MPRMLFNDKKLNEKGVQAVAKISDGENTFLIYF